MLAAAGGTGYTENNQSTQFVEKRSWLRHVCTRCQPGGNGAGWLPRYRGNPHQRRSAQICHGGPAGFRREGKQ